MKSETRDTSQRKLKRQTKFLGSYDNILNQTEPSPVPATPTYEMSSPQPPDARPRTLGLNPNTNGVVEKVSPTSGQRRQQASVSIRKVVATSKFIGAAHRARKQLRLQSRFQPGTFRYRDESGSFDHVASPTGSFEKRSSPIGESDSRQNTKRKVNFLDLVSPSREAHARDHTRGAHARDHTWDTHGRDHTRDTHAGDHARVSNPRGPHAHHKGRIHSEKRNQNIGSSNSAFQWFPRPRVTGSSEQHVISARHDDKSGNDVEELCQEYERMEKTRYAEMLKKAKSLRRENLPFYNRKHDSS